MNSRSLTAGFTLIVLAVAGLVLSTIATDVSAQTDATPLPEVETAVAATLTAVAPTFESMPPTRTARPSPTPTLTLTPSSTPTSTATLTPSSTPTLTPTFTPSPTLSEVERIAGETLTAIFIDQSILQVWVESDDGHRHRWQSQLPKEIRASDRESAELVVVIDAQQRSAGSERYQGCGEVNGYRIVYIASIVDPRDDEVLATEDFGGSAPDFPFIIYSCEDRIGDPPDFTRHFVDWLAPHVYLLGTPTPTPRPTRTPRPPTRTPSPAPPPDADFRPHTLYVTGLINLSLRTCPQVTCDRVGRLKPGDSFFAEGQFTDENGDVWYNLTYEGQTVWVAGWRTSDEPPTD
jgi:hypothetical protein